jgi:hypothetical protein
VFEAKLIQTIKLHGQQIIPKDISSPYNSLFIVERKEKRTCDDRTFITFPLRNGELIEKREVDFLDKPFRKRHKLSRLTYK